MEILNDIKDFFSTLTFVDLVFFFAVIVLLVLIIALIYFIKINEEVLKQENEEVKPKSELELINEAIKTDSDKRDSNITNFEKEQEDKAIISYDELVQNSKNYNLNYSEEKTVDGISIKKVDLEDMYSKEIIREESFTVKLVSYQKEEEFLKSLKNLQSLLN